MSRSILFPAVAIGLALSSGCSGAVQAAPGTSGPHLANRGETAIAFAWIIAGGTWAKVDELLDETETLVPGAVLALNLPEKARGNAAMRLISEDGFVTDVGSIRLRNLEGINYDDGKVTLVYTDERSLLPVQTTSYTGGIDCLNDGRKDADCLMDHADRRHGLDYWPVLWP